MKKFLPIILFLLGLLLFAGVAVFVKSKSSNSDDETSETEEEVVAEIPFEKRPFASLTPKEDGHWLMLDISNAKVEGAKTLDYELIYTLPDGRNQGFPGSVELAEGSIEREILLGSESSGKYRYDEGVEKGTLTLRFRNASGKVVGKLSTDWYLQTGSQELESTDGKLMATLESKADVSEYYVVMQTFGAKDGLSKEPKSGPWGIFSSGQDFSVKVEGIDETLTSDGSQLVILDL